MNPKKMATAALLAFVALSIGAMAYKEMRPAVAGPPATTPQAVAPADGQAPAQSQFVVYYLHGDMRCTTCNRIQSMSETAVLNFFADRLASGEMAWRIVNFDQAPNAHYRDDFDLAFQSVVVAEEVGGVPVRWHNMTDVWTKVHGNEEDFAQYIVDTANAFMAGGDIPS